MVGSLDSSCTLHRGTVQVARSQGQHSLHVILGTSTSHLLNYYSRASEHRNKVDTVLSVLGAAARKLRVVQILTLHAEFYLLCLQTADLP